MAFETDRGLALNGTPLHHNSLRSLASIYQPLSSRHVNRRGTCERIKQVPFSLQACHLERGIRFNILRDLG